MSPSNEGLPRTPDSDSISQKIQKKLTNPPVTTEKKKLLRLLSRLFGQNKRENN